jgi:hypothetical protein
MLIDGHDDFLRELEIRSDQTFKVLHDFIVKNLLLSTRELASFHITDDNWRKLQEITLIDMLGDTGIKEKQKSNASSGFVMSKTPLGTFLSEIDQRLIYEYDFLQMHTFRLEIIDVFGAAAGKVYPNMAYSVGKLKLQNSVDVGNDPDTLQQELLSEFESMMSDDSDGYDDDYDVEEDDY